MEQALHEEYDKTTRHYVRLCLYEGDLDGRDWACNLQPDCETPTRLNASLRPHSELIAEMLAARTPYGLHYAADHSFLPFCDPRNDSKQLIDVIL